MAQLAQVGVRILAWRRGGASASTRRRKRKVHRHHRPARPVDRAGQAPVRDLALAEDVDVGAAPVVVDQHLAAGGLAEIASNSSSRSSSEPSRTSSAANRLTRRTSAGRRRALPGASPGRDASAVTPRSPPSPPPRGTARSPPFSAHSGVISSASLWLSPSTQGHITIVVGATCVDPAGVVPGAGDDVAVRVAEPLRRVAHPRRRSSGVEGDRVEMADRLDRAADAERLADRRAPPRSIRARIRRASPGPASGCRR